VPITIFLHGASKNHAENLDRSVALVFADQTQENVPAAVPESFQPSGAESVTIVVEDFHKSYDRVIAVAGLSFAVAPGEILGLVGPNGAGKTTTLRALAGILTPSRGRLAIAGHDLDKEPVQAKAALAYIPDEPRLFEQLTVWEHFRFIALTYRLKEWRPRAEALLDRFELAEKRDALAADLSRGMRQKTAICCGYLHQPKAILLDEPLTGLDPYGIRTMKDSIRSYATEGTAFIVSSHLLSLIEDLCTSVLILHRGRSLLHGSLAELRQEITASGRQETLEELFFRLTEAAQPPSNVQPAES
jgi:ABC-2 type transport system ATP-binding protein